MKYQIKNNKSGGYFPSTIGYTFVIFTGSRCAGMESVKYYKSYDSACAAAQRMIIKLGGGI